jgi:hypothetical protein
MNSNLLLATGLAYGLLGALVLFASLRSICRTATELVAGYPRVLAKLHLRRIDARGGLALLGAGILLQALAAFGYSVSPVHGGTSLPAPAPSSWVMPYGDFWR